MAPPTKVFPETTKQYYQDVLHQVDQRPDAQVKQMTQFECDLSSSKVVTCVPIDRFFRMQDFRVAISVCADDLERKEAALSRSVPMN